ncbi:MAG: hypothetical protein WD294_05060 [Phycisphaeraceae bacterium]
MNILPRLTIPAAALALTAAAVLASQGCVAAGWLADGFVDPNAEVKVPAEYLELENQRVAVLVDADLSVVFEHPLAQLEVATILSERLTDHVPGVTVRNPREIITFQQRNLYWNTSSYADLMERLEVDRLVVVELVDYRLHEPGNVNIWRGLMTANIGVTEVEAPNPNDLVYATTVSVEYPPDSEVGLLNADQRTIRLATLERFAQATIGKFYEHKSRR